MSPNVECWLFGSELYPLNKLKMSLNFWYMAPNQAAWPLTDKFTVA